MMSNPALDPATHPIILHTDLHAEDPRAPQTQFVVERQVAFLEALATTGSVRAAARRARVSHQTCYRARRASAGFGRAWDAALVVARGAAEAKLADYAMNGVEEEVWYHGDLVGSRKRVSDRLLLAHLGRLDRMRGDERIERLAENFDAMVLRLRRGEPIEVEDPHHDPAHAEPVEAGSPDAGAHGQARGEREGGENSSPGPCNTRSMSQRGDPQNAPPQAGASHPAEPPCDCVGARHGTDRGQPHYRRGAEGLEPVVNVGAGGPCCDTPRWPDCRACPHYPPVDRMLDELAEAEAQAQAGIDAGEGADADAGAVTLTR
ncbi:MAG: hypothetical protein ACI8QU_001756 [Devosia litorisediminis]|jgi:hypothetical protein